MTDLAGEAEHVGIQPVLQQSRFLNLVGGTMRGGLIDDACQCAKLLGAGGYSRVVQRICHLGFSFGWESQAYTMPQPRRDGGIRSPASPAAAPAPRATNPPPRRQARR